MKSENMIPVKQLKIVLQKESGLCGPAALRILLSYFNIYKTERLLARLCKTTHRSGTSPQMIIVALKKLGFEVKTGTWGSKERCWRTLNYWINYKNLPVLVDWFSKDDGHYSVAFRLTKNHIWLADPEPRKKQERTPKIEWNVFMRLWHDFEGDYPRRLKDFDKTRWWAVAIPAPLSKIKKK